jgi:hypothetical protein
MFYKRILFIGCSFITYNVLSYLEKKTIESEYYVYDDSKLSKNEFRRISWWNNDKKDYEKTASKLCALRFKNIKVIQKNDLSKFGSEIEMPECVIFTSSHIFKKESFDKLIDKLKKHNVRVIFAVNHSLFAYFNNCVDGNIKINSLNEFIKKQYQLDNSSLINDYMIYINSCISSNDPDNFPEIFSKFNMNSIFYPLSSILSMMLIESLINLNYKKSIIFDWSLLKPLDLYVKQTDDDYRYIATTEFLHQMRSESIFINASDNINILELVMLQLYNLGIFDTVLYKSHKIYIKSKEKLEFNDKRIAYIDEVSHQIIKAVDRSIYVGSNHKIKNELCNLHITYEKPISYIHDYPQIPFTESVISVPNITPTYIESSYSILDISNNSVEGEFSHRMIGTTAMLIVQWMIDIYMKTSEKVIFMKYINMRIDNDISLYGSLKFKEYYNNSFSTEHNRVIHTIPDRLSLWTHIDIYENRDSIYKLCELLEYLREEHAIVPYKIIYNENNILYDKEVFMNKKKKELDKLLKSWIYKRTTNRNGCIEKFNIFMTDTNGDDIICPTLYYHFNK